MPPISQQIAWAALSVLAGTVFTVTLLQALTHAYPVDVPGVVCQDSVYVVPPEASEVTAYDCAAGQIGTAHVASDGTAIVLCRCPETAP